MFIVSNFDKITKIDDQKMIQKALSMANQQIPVPSSSTAHRKNMKRKFKDESSTPGCSNTKRKPIIEPPSDSDEEDE